MQSKLLRPLCTLAALVAGAACAQALPASLDDLPQEEAARLCIISLDAASRQSVAQHRPATFEERTRPGTLFVLHTYWVEWLYARAPEPEQVSLRGDLHRHLRLPAPDTQRLQAWCEQAALASMDKLPPAREKAIVEKGLVRMRQALGEE